MDEQKQKTLGLGKQGFSPITTTKENVIRVLKKRVSGSGVNLLIKHLAAHIIKQNSFL